MTRSRKSLRTRPCMRVGALLVALAIVSLAAGEILFRVAYTEKLKLHARPLIYEPSERLGYRYIPGAVGRIRSPGIDQEVAVNEHGFLGPSFDVAKAPGVFRVAVLDASNGAGIRVVGLDCFPKMLQRKCDAAGWRVEVLNFSVDGTQREFTRLRLLEEPVLAFAPDLVLLLVKQFPFVSVVFHRDMHNDWVYTYGHSGQSHSDLARQRAQSIRTLDRLDRHPVARAYARSFLVRAFFRWYRRGRDNELIRLVDAYGQRKFRCEYAKPLRFQPETCIRLLREARDKVREAGADLVVYRYGLTDLHATARSHAGIETVYLDIPPDPVTGARSLGHYGAHGHAYVADELFRLLGDRLPPEFRDS